MRQNAQGRCDPPECGATERHLLSACPCCVSVIKHGAAASTGQFHSCANLLKKIIPLRNPTWCGQHRLFRLRLAVPVRFPTVVISVHVARAAKGTPADRSEE